MAFSLINDYPPNLWIDGWSASAFTQSGGFVDSAIDKSGFNRHLSAAGAARPKYNKIGKRLEFGAGQYLKRANDATFLNTGTFSIYALCARANTAAVIKPVFAKWDSNAAQAQALLGFNATENAIGSLTADGSTAGTLTVNTIASLPYQPCILSFVNQNVSGTYTASLLYTGNQGLSGASAAAFNSTADFGINYVLAAAGLFQGWVYELLVYNTGHTPEVRALIEAYIAHRWGKFLADQSPKNIVRPSISGSDLVGSVLTVGNGQYNNFPRNYLYQFTRDRVPFGVLSSVNSYTSTPDDIGKKIGAFEYACNADGSTSLHTTNQILITSNFDFSNANNSHHI